MSVGPSTHVSMASVVLTVLFLPVGKIVCLVADICYLFACMVADLSAVAHYGFSSILMLNLSEPMHNAGVRK